EAEGVAVADGVRRAQAFLIKTQRPDGSWPMTSRPAEPPGPGPARNLGPIRYVGTALATMGLVRTSAKRSPLFPPPADAPSAPDSPPPSGPGHQQATSESAPGQP